MPVETVMIDTEYPWLIEKRAAMTLWYGGDLKSARFAAERILSLGEALRESEISDALASCGGFYSLIIETPETLFACTDPVRSQPIFYAAGNGGVHVSNAARLLRDRLHLNTLDTVGRLEFNLSGYVTGSDTLYEGLSQMQGGEWLLWRRSAKTLLVKRYRIYFPDAADSIQNDADFDAAFDAVNDAVFRRAMERADGAPIWVPLSGGLDSRLVLCQLKKLGYPRLHAYSYGPPGNHEAKAARLVAQRLDVPWTFVPSRCREARAAFDSPKRRKFWEYSDFLSVVPFLSDFQSLDELLASGRMPKDAVVIVGQSGDFVSGGHLPARDAYRRFDFDALFEKIVAKHFSLWTNLLTPENVAQIRQKALRLLGIEEGKDYGYDGISAWYELWEAQERQFKYVVNGQKLYEFFGLRWELPMWDREYFDFWRNIPASRKFGQKLYKEYLDRRDDYGLFRSFKPTIWRWPGMTMAIPLFAQPIKWFLGRKAADSFYKKMAYWGYYRNQYAPYGYRHYLSVAQNIRHSVSLHVERWLEENLPTS